MPHTVGCTGSAIAIEAKTLFIEDGLEEFALPLRKNEVSGFGHAPLFASSCGGHERFTGRVHAINARRAKPAAKSLKGPHCTRHTLVFAVNTGLRPDEAWRLQFRDVTVVDDEGQSRAAVPLPS